ncbi:hypothetical protein RTP6_006814 [Batrachochytrium dendrobatidis]
MDSPEFNEAIRRAPKGMFKEDENGIHVGFEDLFRKEPKQAGPGEMIGMLYDLGKSDDINAQILFWVVLVIFVIPIVIGMVFVLFGSHRQKRKLVPAISSWIPFGVTLWFSRNPLDFIMTQGKKYSKGFSIPLGFSEFTVFAGVKGQKLISAFEDDKMSFAQGFKLQFEKTLVSGRLKIVQDQYLQSVLTKPRFTDQIQSYLPEMLRARLDHIKNEESVDLFKFSSDIALRLLTRLAIGQKLLDENDDDIIPLMQTTEKTLMSPGTLFFRSFSFGTSASKTLFQDLRIIIQEEIEFRKENPSDESYYDIISILTKAAPQLSVDGIVSHINLFIFANHSDIAGTIAWTLYHLIQDRTLQTRVLTEYAQAVSVSDTVKDNVSTQPCLTSIIKEVGRLYAPLFLIRGSFKKQPIGNYDIYFCDIVATSPAMIALNEKIYESPKTFDASRFLDQQKIQVLTQQQKLLQFNNAQHAWFDHVIAETMIKRTIIPTILETYHIELVDKKFTPRPSYLESFSTPFSDLPLCVKFSSKACMMDNVSKQSNAKKSK